MSGTRLNKYIASSGLCSRRKADELIDSGVVAVNGKKITELGYTVQPKDKVFVNGKMIHPVKHEYYRFYKPAGYITTIDGKISQNDIDKMYKGIEIEPNKLAYAEVDVLEVDDKHTVMEILLYQGMNRQIRKMFEFLGFNVLTLKRIQHATLNLDGMKRGDLKPIKPQQIKELRNFLNRISKNND